MKNLFTFVMDWNQGVFIAQSQGDDISEATANWVNNLKASAIETTDFCLEMFRKSILEDLSPTPLKGVVSVWCISDFLDEQLAIVNVVETIQNR